MIGLYTALKKVLDIKKLFNIQKVQYSEKLFLEDTVTAGKESLGRVNISSLGHFYLKYMTVSYTTLSLDGGDIKDDGVNHLRSKMVDGSNQRDLFNDYIPLNLFASPGREKSLLSITALTDAPSGSLFYPQEFEYLFTINTSILWKTKNDSDANNTVRVCFHGIRRLPLRYSKVKEK